jgi:hypothetical protein
VRSCSHSSSGGSYGGGGTELSKDACDLFKRKFLKDIVAQ